MRRGSAAEYLRGALWVLPTVGVALALAAGFALSQIEVPPQRWYVFQGTADDARTLLIAVSSTLATVIALVLGLTVVALQLASTQFSPRLLRNFLRDTTNQVALSILASRSPTAPPGCTPLASGPESESTSIPGSRSARCWCSCSSA